jgi:hypothetical protein
LGDIAAMHQRLQNSIDAGLGDVGLFVNVFKTDRPMNLFQKFENVEPFGENGDEIEALDLGFRQRSLLNAWISRGFQ